MPDLPNSLNTDNHLLWVLIGSLSQRLRATSFELSELLSGRPETPRAAS